MNSKGPHLLNLCFLENRIRELDLKNWWVAERIGVDRKTLTRWLTGKVKTIRDENLAALAECLKCNLEDLVLHDESMLMASQEEQSIAAQLMIQENLLATLTPLGQWPLLESMVKATLQPNLPLPLMGKLYNLLSICAWRQDQLDKAEAFARRALSIGEKVGSKIVTVGAKCNLATIFSFRGRLSESLSLYQDCIENSRFLEDDAARGAALSNLSTVHHQIGDFEQAIQIQKQAIEVYEALKLPTNLSIAYGGLGLVETEVGLLEEAEKSLHESLRYAELAKYIRGKHACPVYLADVYARQGDFPRAHEFLSRGLEGFRQIAKSEGLNFEIAGRIHRLQKKWAEAQALLEAGLEHAKQFLLERAALLVELSLISTETGSDQLARQHREEADEIYKKCGARKRLSLE